MLIQKYLRVWYFPLGDVVLHAIREGLRLIRNVKCLPTSMFSLQKKVSLHHMSMYLLLKTTHTCV